MAKEIWDAYDKDGNLLGFDLVRGEKFPNGVYHMVAEIYTITNDNEVLLTKRNPNKPWGLKWEITGGSLLKGETPLQGAVRELKEETGIEALEENLKMIYSYTLWPTIYKCYLHFIDKESTKVILSPDETIDYKYMMYDDFVNYINTDDYVDILSNRFLLHKDIFDKTLSMKR